MPHAVTLRLDEAAAARVARIWQALAAAGADDTLRLGYPPHVTLAVLPDDAPADEIEAAVAGLARGWDAAPVTLAGFGLFPGAPPVLWLAPVPDAALLARQAALLAALAPMPVHPHYAAGAWVPHVTLSKEASLPAGRLLELAAAAWDGPISGSFDRLELVRFRPVTVLRSARLSSPGCCAP